MVLAIPCQLVGLGTEITFCIKLLEAGATHSKSNLTVLAETIGGDLFPKVVLSIVAWESDPIRLRSGQRTPGKY